MSNIDLYSNKYDRKTLKDNIYAVKQIDILKTQTLDLSFIVKYIMNDKYNLTDEEAITEEMVLKYQPHINRQNLLREINSYYSDDDSVDNFDVVAFR